MLKWRKRERTWQPHGEQPLPLTTPTPPKPPFHKRVLKEWIIPLAIVAAVVTPIRSVVADWNDVPSGSMRPTILEGDRIYVNKLAYGLRVPFTTSWIARWDTPQRGDIVTLKSPDDGIRLVKRVIGLPGDHLSMQGNHLMINGVKSGYKITDDEQTFRLPNGRVVNVLIAQEALTDQSGVVRTHALTLTPGAISRSTWGDKVVPAGQYFVMGDNRDMSRDSRFIGFVPEDSIYGRAGYVALSLDPDNNYFPRWGRWFTEMK